MKFQRHIKARDDREITPRRLACAERRLQKQREEVALFPELGPQESAQERCERISRENTAHWQRIRDHEAASWRKGRKAFRALPPEMKAQVEQRYWGNKFMPKTAVYLLEVLREVKIEAGINPST